MYINMPSPIASSKQYPLNYHLKFVLEFLNLDKLS